MSGIYYDMPFFSKGSGDDGRDGVSPTITITDIDGGHRLTIVDVNGIKTVDVLNGIQGLQGEPGTDGINGKDGVNGKDGTAGKDGADGRGIKALIINTEGELVVSYTDNTEGNLGKVVGAQGIQGEQGPAGEKGETGEQGPEGPQGPAYVLTAEDKAAIVAEVLAALETQPEV